MKDVKMIEQMDMTCDNCICSVCFLAESNGGAPGCGNCMECNANNPVTSCKEFWCPLRFVPYNNDKKGVLISMGITSNEEFNLYDSDISFEDVIDGLNKYFAEDETRVRVPRSIVEIRGRNRILFYRFDAEMYLDKLIAWLRTEHGIFYYPGMEAKYDKTERIPPLTERSMDEGALNSLKKLYKRVTGEEPEVDSHTIIADGIWNAVSVKDSQIMKLQTQMRKQGEELRILKSKCSSLNEKDIMDYIRQEASRNRYNLPEKVDGEPLTIERVFHDLFDLMRRRGEELRILGLKCRRMNEIVEELNTLNDEIKKENPYE